MRRIFALLWAPLFAAAAAHAGEARPHPCQVRGAGDALCATLPVWENRNAGSGRKIDLNIVILPALHRDHAPDPVFVLDGGPGGAATRFAPFFSRQPLRDTRDIVMIDQRGTGGSNPLNCDLYGDPPDLQRMMTSEFPVDRIRACREALSQIADLAQYTTSIAMDDVDEVRQWLGYRQINLWGGSYGTLSAQIYLRRHEGSLRSAVLDGVLPADELNPLHHASAGQRAIDLLFDRCKADRQCHAAYPHLPDDFAAMLDRARKGAEAQVHDRYGRTARVRPGLAELADGIRHRLYADTGTALAGMIHDGAAGHLDAIVQAAVDANLGLKNIIAEGLLLSVTCSEDLPFITDEMTARETAHTFLGDLRIREQKAACAEWVRGAIPKDFHEPVRSRVPVLLMSGYLDPVTPPEFGDRVAKGLPNSKHVVFRQSSHGNTGPCGRELMTAFIERGTAAGLDTSCASH